MSDDEHRLAVLAFGLGCGMILGGSVIFDRWEMPATGFALIAMGLVLVYSALSEAGRDDE